MAHIWMQVQSGMEVLITKESVTTAVSDIRYYNEKPHTLNALRLGLLFHTRNRTTANKIR